MMISFLYEIILWVLAIIYLPKLAYDYFIQKKYQKSLMQRLGFNFPLIKKGKRKLIWIHAVSVGETKAVSSLVKTIHRELNNPLIIISSITETGHEEAKRSIPLADYHVYLPWDLSFIIRPIVKRVAPDWVIIAETDLWYNFLKSAKKNGAIIALVNGKISQRSWNRFKKFPYFTKKLFSVFDLLCLQSQHYYDRFRSLGLDESKLYITGNLKFDDEYPRFSDEERDAWKKQLQISVDDQVVVVGSSHDSEEKMILEQFKIVWTERPKTKLVIVPRHPERFNQVAGLLQKENISYMRFSLLGAGDANAKVILVDAMGLLRKCYQLADVAIVAGSYVQHVGGHNILEPSSYGVPVIYGPFMQSQPELVELMREYKAGFEISMPDLARQILDLLKDGPKRTQVGENGLRMLKDVNGGTQKTWQALKQFVA